MRRVIITAAVLCCAVLFGAQTGFPPGVFLSRGALDASSGGGACVPNTQANAFFTRVTAASITIDAAHTSAYCNLINCQVTAGTFALKDIQYALATNTTAGSAPSLSLLNLIQNNFNASQNGSSSFTADAGWQAGAALSSLTTGFNPTTATTPQFVRNSAHHFLWNLTNATNGNAIAGNDATGVVGESNFFIKLTSPANLFVRLNDAVDNGGIAIGTPTGWLGGSRTSLTNIDYYQNNSTLGSVSQTSAAPENAAFQILGIPVGANADQTHQIGFWSLGAAMNSTQEAADYACVHAYMQTIAGVP